MRFSKSLARMFSFLREFHSCVCGIKTVIIEKITIQKKNWNGLIDRTLKSRTFRFYVHL